MNVEDKVAWDNRSYASVQLLNFLREYRVVLTVPTILEDNGKQKAGRKS